jgi:hypothetical protein
MFHDLGLNSEFRGSGRRFEVDSADEARRFPQGHGVPEDSIRRVEYDVLGIGYHDVSDDDRAEITALHPRPDSSEASWRRSPKASRPSRKRRSATSRRTSWSGTSPATSAATSWTSSLNSDWPE